MQMKVLKKLGFHVIFPISNEVAIHVLRFKDLVKLIIENPPLIVINCDYPVARHCLQLNSYCVIAIGYFYLGGEQG